MKRFVIKVTYLSGRHKGKTYFLKRGGYVYSKGEFVLKDDTYASESIAKRVCTLYTNNNKRDNLSEIKYNEYRKSMGYEVRDWLINELESYEPYELNENYIVSI